MRLASARVVGLTVPTGTLPSSQCGGALLHRLKQWRAVATRFDKRGQLPLVVLAEVPRPSVGAPLPVARLLLAYLLDVPGPGWDGTWTRVVDVDTATPVVLVGVPPGERTPDFRPPWAAGAR